MFRVQIDDQVENLFSLFVGNIGTKTTVLDLEIVFKKYTSFSNCRVIHKKKEHYGFVTFTNYRDAATAMLNEKSRDLGKGRLIIKVAKKTKVNKIDKNLYNSKNARNN